MGLFNRRKDDDEYLLDTSDVLIVFNDDNKTSDIKRITAIEEDEVIVAGLYRVPLQDCEVTVGAEGRNLFYRAPAQSITETQRLAQMEYNMVLRHITAYKPPVQPAQMDWTKGLLFAALIIAIFF